MSEYELKLTLVLLSIIDEDNVKKAIDNIME